MAEAPASVVDSSEPPESRLLSLPQELQDSIQEEVFDAETVINTDYRAPALLRALRTSSAHQGIFIRATNTFYEIATFEVAEEDFTNWLQTRHTSHAKLIETIRVHLKDANHFMIHDRDVDTNPIPYFWAFCLATTGVVTRNQYVWATDAWKQALEVHHAAKHMIEKIRAADSTLALPAFKIKLETANGHHMWTSNVLQAIWPLPIRAGHMVTASTDKSEGEDIVEDSQSEEDQNEAEE